jgi:hypothetical protein
VRLKFALVGLLIPLIALLSSCNVGPPDKWPDIITWNLAYNYDTTLSFNDAGLPTFSQIDPTADVNIQVRTFNVNQDFRISLSLDRAEEFVQVFDGNLIPIGSTTRVYQLNERHIVNPAIGTYVPGSGHPPQGITELGLFFEPELVGKERLLVIQDPFTGSVQSIELTMKLTMYYTIIVEDLDGRTDSFEANFVSDTIID